VEKFLAGLTERVRNQEEEVLKAIADGDWSEDTQTKVEAVVSDNAEDFGFDLDEEGHPIEDSEEAPLVTRRSGNGTSEQESPEQEEAAVPA
jgi:F-type H+-transporting ATPase subunit alpha